MIGGGGVPRLAWSQDGTPSPTITFTRRPTPLPTATPTSKREPTATPTAFSPERQLYFCSLGANDGRECFFPGDAAECPDGVCVRGIGVCASGPQNGGECVTSAECDGAPCVLTQKVCGTGEREGFFCLRDNQCGSGIRCISTGLFCSKGVFDTYPCVEDRNCKLQNSDAGTCVAPEKFVCSAPGTDLDDVECSDHPDCDGGACVLGVRVCDGGSIDGFGCQGDIHCDGGRCVPTARLCNGGPFDDYACLRDEHCGTGGACISSGLFCDGGSFQGTFYSCLGDGACALDPPYVSGMCVAPLFSPRVCSAGPNDAQICEVTADCPEGACVRTQGLCATQETDIVHCDSDADCSGGRLQCVATYAVCGSGAYAGLPCINDDQCAGQACLASGRVCDGGLFSTLSCVTDFDCNCISRFECDTSSIPPGGCEGATPRPCSFAAPCPADGREEQVFAFSNGDQPAVGVDYYVEPIPVDVEGLVAVVRMTGGDADLYIGTEVSGRREDYPVISERAGETSEEVRIDGHSGVTFGDLVAGATDVAFAVVGFDQAPFYTLTVLFLGSSAPGDIDCAGGVNAADVEGLLAVLFDPATRLTTDGAIGRCIGGDANDDGREAAADIVGVMRRIGSPQ